DEAVRLFHEIDGPCVLKPLTGSGSELVFRVDNEADCRRAFEQVIAGLKACRTAPLYRSCKEGQASVLVEECVEGDEFSCDFLIENRRIRIVRLTKKYRRRHSPFGTIEAYELSADRPDVCRDSRLAPHLLAAASSLGIDRAICMADFIVCGDGRPKFLELTPRCGGDCLPSLLKTACDFDVLGLALRFARGNVRDVAPRVVKRAVALRLFADRSGVLERTDTTALMADPRVLSVTLTKQPGARLRLPPADYDSWILGHVIYRPDRSCDVHTQNDELTSLFQMRIAEQ
ncbi:MAG TPA: ATP-grasp domain-containing protein, partial [Thermoguttaceae bacterium]|nr:ATP-grasp domain-containing protein [Thermoguttaceae bacterium]